MVKDGDWIEVPSFGADGIVTDVSLNTIKVQNWDKTITAVPTYKLVEVPFKNYRGMEESGGRRIVLTFTFAMESIGFCDAAFLGKLSKYDLIADFVREQIDDLKESELESARSVDFPLDGPQITNIHLFMEYAKAYLKTRKDMRQRRFLFLLRVVEPTREGLPLQIIVFTKNIPLVEFSATQSEILMHLVAAAPYFGLRIFQEPTGADFQALKD
jgi:miniconductance mechanosensitive channel